MNIRHDPVIHDTNRHIAQLDEAEQYDLQAEAVMKRAKEIAAEIITADGYKDANGVTYNLGDVTERIYQNDDEADTFHTILASLVTDKTEASQIFMEMFLLRHAKQDAEEIAWREAG